MKIDPRALREFSGMNQTDFWSSVGITQSGGSRYEGGRRLPKSVAALLRLVYIDRVDLSTVRRADMELIAYLKSERQALYRKLRREAVLHARRP